MGTPWAVTVMGASCFLLVVGVALFVPDLWKLNLVPDYEVVPSESTEI